MKNRYHNEKIYGQLYRKLNLYGEDVCTYCSSYADTIDHVLPISHTVHLKEQGFTPPEDMMLLVPCCKECNSLLGNKIFKSLKEKKEYLLNRYKKRYKAIINQPELDDDEDYGFSLLRMLKSLENQRQTVLDRLAFLEISL